MASAARQLGITQPAVSQTIAELEARTGGLLFDRKVRPIGLTQPGAVLRQRASMLLAEARQIGPLLREVGQGRLPFLRVGIVDSLSRALTGPLSRFLDNAASQSSVLAGLTAAHVSALATRQLDILLGAEEVQDVEGLERHPLREECHVLLLPPGQAPPADLDALARLGSQLPLVRFSARSRTGMEIDRHLRRLGLNPRRVQEFDTPYGVSAAVAAGMGWAITTPLCLQEAALTGADLVECALPGPPLRRRLLLIARQKELGTLPTRMAEMCRTELANGATRRS